MVYSYSLLSSGVEPSKQDHLRTISTPTNQTLKLLLIILAANFYHLLPTGPEARKRQHEMDRNCEQESCDSTNTAPGKGGY